MPRSPRFRKDYTLGEVVGSLRRPSPVPETGWHLLGTGSEEGINWENDWNGSSTKPPAYYLSEDGRLRHRGNVIPPDSVTLPSTIWTYPSQYRPEIEEGPFVLGLEGGGYANVVVQTDGSIVCQSMTVA